MTLTDPCDPPAAINVPSLDDQQYSISDPAKTPYTHPEFVADPVYCKVTYSYDLGSITNNGGDTRSAVTRSDKTFSFFYDEDLAPVTPNPQTQVTQITATSFSEYATTQPATVVSGSFNTSF